MFRDKVESAEAILMHSFADKKILLRALTHPSALDCIEGLDCSYERLEYLGDSVLGFIIALHLYENYPQLDEGKLTRMKVLLVAGSVLSKVGKELGLDSCIILGGSEEGTEARGMKSAIENVFEACVGALMLDGGLVVAQRFVLSALADQVDISQAYIPESPKSVLQEYVQKRSKEPPSYKLISQGGPAHDPFFEVAVLACGKELGRGHGRSKKAAEAEAALSALKALNLC